MNVVGFRKPVPTLLRAICYILDTIYCDCISLCAIGITRFSTFIYIVQSDWRERELSYNKTVFATVYLQRTERQKRISTLKWWNENNKKCFIKEFGILFHFLCSFLLLNGRVWMVWMMRFQMLHFFLL